MVPPSVPPPVTPYEGPRAVTDIDFPEGRPTEHQLLFMLNAAILAPSVLNTQPWRFEVAGREARLFADRSRQLRVLDPDGRELVVSCGAALMNLRLAARHYGYAVGVESFPDPATPDLLAVLRLGRPHVIGVREEALYRAIPERRTNRYPFAGTPIPAGTLDALREAAEAEGAALHALTTVAEKDAIADLITEGLRLQNTDRAANDEVRAWLRADRDPRRDGVPDSEQGEWNRLSQARATPDPSAARKRKLIATSPAVLVLTTPTDTVEAWLAAGQALERVLLTATHRGLSASYLNTPVEVGALRPDLARLVGGAHPQVVFRIGFPVRQDGTPRRYVRDVLKK